MEKVTEFIKKNWVWVVIAVIVIVAVIIYLKRKSGTTGGTLLGRGNSVGVAHIPGQFGNEQGIRGLN